MRSTIVTFICGRLSRKFVAGAVLRRQDLSNFGGRRDDSQPQIRARSPAGRFAKAQRLEVRGGTGSTCATASCWSKFFTSRSTRRCAVRNQRRQVLRLPPVGIGEVMRAGGLGRVVKSKNPAFKPGDYVTGLMGVQGYAISDGKGLNKINPKIAPLPVYLGGLGMTGMTAYFGLLDVGQPKTGETVVISAAAGATGMIAGQIAKIKGCRAVGIAGGAAKCEFIVKELGYDAAIDYKAEDVRKALQQHCPKGIDIYFDNVGGEGVRCQRSRSSPVGLAS